MEPQNPEIVSPQISGRIKLLFSVFLLIIAADILIYGIPLGAGMTLFSGFVWLGLRLNRPSSATNWKDWLLYSLMCASALQTAVEPSFSNWLVLFLLTIYASGHFLHRQIAPYWRRALEGLFGLLNISLAFFNIKRGLWDAKNSIQTPAVKGTTQQGRRWCAIFLPAIIVTIPFLFLFGSGNAIIGEEIKTTLDQVWAWVVEIKFPSFIRIIFWMSVGLALLALLSKSPLSLKLSRAVKRLPCVWHEPKDVLAGVWSTRILLISVNVIFFTANSVDVFYLWMETELPEGITFSKYVHQGVYNLIACVALAASILLIIFQQDKRVTRERGQKLLAHIWVAQNFLLISSVFLRLKLYVDTYHLSLLRLYVAFFLFLVVVGFILLAIKIHQERKFVWLVNSNLLAVFLLFFLVQLLNDRNFVAHYNYEQALSSRKGVKKLDVKYLVGLGPAAWPILQKVAEDASRFGSSADLAKEQLEIAARDEKSRIEKSDWRSWQYRRWVNRRSLPGSTNENLYSRSTHPRQ